MGHNAIERGNRDSWTITPKVVEAARAAARSRGERRPWRWAEAEGRPGGRGGAAEFERLFHDPARRDPRGYILPADQPDFLTATKFINTLLGTGVQVHRATADFTVAGKKYPQGSYVVKTAQAFRAACARHVRAAGPPQRLRLSRRPRRPGLTTPPATRRPSRWP